MNSQQILAVRETFALLAPQADGVARLFYERLFQLDPKLGRLFEADMTEQRGKLMAMLAAGVGGLNRFDTLRPTLRQLGARHVAYGVHEDHYRTVGAALLDTLARGLGNAFTPEVRAAWTEAYALIAGTMQAGAAVAIAA